MSHASQNKHHRLARKRKRQRRHAQQKPPVKRLPLPGAGLLAELAQPIHKQAFLEAISET
jgi:hypothetical protein